MAYAGMKGIPLRWGGDRDSDTDLHDQNFMDPVYFELIVNPNKTGIIDRV